MQTNNSSQTKTIAELPFTILREQSTGELMPTISFTRRSASSTALPLSFLRSLLIIPWIFAFASSQASSPTGDPFPFLKDVAGAVAEKERWDPEAVRVSRLLDGGRAKVGRSQRYDLLMRAAGKAWGFGVPGGLVTWKPVKRRAGGGILGPDFFASSRSRRGSLRSFRLEGPLELRAAGEGQLSVLLPGNNSHHGIKKVIVREGVRVKIKMAIEVSVVIPNDLRFLINGSLVPSKEYNHRLWPLEDPLCHQLLAVSVRGDALVTAYRSRDSSASIEPLFHSPNIFELQAEKCFLYKHLRRRLPFDILSLGSRLELVDKVLTGFLGHKVTKTGIPHFVKVKVTSVTVVKFSIEMERELKDSDIDPNKTAPWKTKPRVERAEFEIIARLEDRKRLKAVTIKKLKKPFIIAEITAWSRVSNLSLSRLLSSIMPPEPLTLDVKW